MFWCQRKAVRGHSLRMSTVALKIRLVVGPAMCRSLNVARGRAMTRVRLRRDPVVGRGVSCRIWCSTPLGRKGFECVCANVVALQLSIWCSSVSLGWFDGLCDRLLFVARLKTAVQCTQLIVKPEAGGGKDG